MEDGLFPVRISKSVDVSPSLRFLELDLAESQFSKAYAIPGQYVKMSLASLPATYFSMASGPDLQGSLQFLLRMRGPLGEKVRGVEIGDQVGISEVGGAGFPVAKALGKDILLFATGSGIAPIRALTGYLMKRRDDYGSITLYYGDRTPGELAFGPELKLWEKQGLTVHLTVSKSEAEAAKGAHLGYVQDCLASQPHPNPDAVAFLCGVGGMVKSVTEILSSCGLDEKHICLNY